MIKFDILGHALCLYLDGYDAQYQVQIVRYSCLKTVIAKYLGCKTIYQYHTAILPDIYFMFVPC